MLQWRATEDPMLALTRLLFTELASNLDSTVLAAARGRLGPIIGWLVWTADIFGPIMGSITPEIVNSRDTNYHLEGDRRSLLQLSLANFLWCFSSLILPHSLSTPFPSQSQYSYNSCLMSDFILVVEELSLLVCMSVLVNSMTQWQIYDKFSRYLIHIKSGKFICVNCEV